MTWAHVEGGEVTQIGEPPRSFVDPSTGETIDLSLPDSRTVETYASFGWFPLERTDKPADTAEGTFEGSLQVVGGLPKEVWTFRAWSPDELAEKAARDAQRTIEEALDAALVDLQTLIDTPNATINSGPATAIKLLARVLRRVIRLLIRRLDATT